MEQALKKFVACIYLKNGKATRGLSDHTVVSNDPGELSLTYAMRTNVIHCAVAGSWDDFRKDPQGLLPVVVQEASTGDVLMVAYMNEEAYNNTVSTGRMTYWSRSRSQLWIKGETSGHFQYVRSLMAESMPLSNR